MLFVCTGNTCRSPMAAAIAQSLSDSVTAGSAGINAFNGGGASLNAAAAMRSRRLSLDGHRSKKVERDDIEDAYVVLTMTRSHKDALISMFPDQAEKIFSLGEYAGAPMDISDPYGGDLAQYERCAAELEALVRRAIDKASNDFDWS
jgi:protein-tyrosine phosphatase